MNFKKYVQILLIFMAIVLLMGVTAATELSHDIDSDYSEKIITSDETAADAPESIVSDSEKIMKNNVKANNTSNKVIRKNASESIKKEDTSGIPTRLSLNFNKKNISICESFTIYGQLTDENNTPLTDKSIHYYLDDEFQKTVKTDNKGIFIIKECINTTKFYDYRNYFRIDIGVKFIGSTVKLKYLNSENSASIKVYIPMSGYVYAHDPIIRLGQTTQIEGKIYSNRFKALPNQDIMIKYKHERFKNETIIHTRTNQSGEFKYNITPTKLGKYHITLYGPHNKSYYEIDDDDLNVKSYGFAQIETDPEIWLCKVGQQDNVIIYGRVFDIVTNKGISFHRIDNAYLTNDPDNDPENVKHPFHKNIPLNATTDKNGNYMLTIPFKQLPQKTLNSEYYCILSSKSTREYVTFDSYEGYSILLNIKNRTSIKLKEIRTTEYAKTANITGKLSDNKNKSIKNALIKLIINDESVNVTTNKQGIFHYTYKTRINGDNNVTAYYKGDTDHGATLSTTKIRVVKAAKISINKIKTTQFKDKILITGKLTGNSGEVLSNSILKLKINNRTTQIKTNKKGIFKYAHKTYKIGTNTIIISFTGNTAYKSMTLKTTFKVAQRRTKLTLTRIAQRKYGQKVTIMGKLTDKTGTILKSRQIKIRINTKTYTVKTNSKGIYIVKLVADKVGSSKVMVTYSGNNYYKAVITKTTFKTIP